MLVLWSSVGALVSSVEGHWSANDTKAIWLPACSLVLLSNPTPKTPPLPQPIQWLGTASFLTSLVMTKPLGNTHPKHSSDLQHTLSPNLTT